MRAEKGKPLNGHNLYLMFSVFCMMGIPDVRQPMVMVHCLNITHSRKAGCRTMFNNGHNLYRSCYRLTQSKGVFWHCNIIPPSQFNYIYTTTITQYMADVNHHRRVILYIYIYIYIHIYINATKLGTNRKLHTIGSSDGKKRWFSTNHCCHK